MNEAEAKTDVSTEGAKLVTMLYGTWTLSYILGVVALFVAFWWFSAPWWAFLGLLILGIFVGVPLVAVREDRYNRARLEKR
jgi:membrane protein YdbS with pleckstrin-like domain